MSYQPKPCGCKKAQCTICNPVVFYPYFNPFTNPPSNASSTKAKCEEPICRTNCDPFLPLQCVPCKRKIVTWRIKYLVSNLANEAAHQDINLLNPWDLIIANNQLWVVDATTDAMLNFDLYGNPLRVPIGIKSLVYYSAYPTAMTINREGNFVVNSNITTRTAFILISTAAGTVNAYNPDVFPDQAPTVISQTKSGQIVSYHGITVIGNYLYCVDFYGGKIDVFNSSYILQTSFPFIDGDTSDPIPADFGPYNIFHIGRYLYVNYCRHTPGIPQRILDGPGNGYISIFNPDGTFVRRFYSRGVLNSPVSIIAAPCEYGFPKDGLLVANYGDGTINIFDCRGEFMGKILSPAGLPISIFGLWAIAPYYTCNNEIYFCASPGNELEKHGIVGSLVVDQVLTI
jgi:uncharacterized protein (TIGR03118 family)